MLPQGTNDIAHPTSDTAPRTENTGHRGQRTEERATRPRSATAETQWHEAGTPGRSAGLWPVPIAEVGTQVTDWSGSRGIILDVEDQAGTLIYLVQFEQRGCGAHCQRIPARALKGVQL